MKVIFHQQSFAIEENKEIIKSKIFSKSSHLQKNYPNTFSKYDLEFVRWGTLRVSHLNMWLCVCVCVLPKFFWSQLKVNSYGIKSKVCLFSQYNSTGWKAWSDWGDKRPGDNCPRRQLTIINHFKSDSNGIKSKVCLLS